MERCICRMVRINMERQKLIEWINESRRRKFSYDEIKQHLCTKGYSNEDIDRLMSEAGCNKKDYIPHLVHSFFGITVAILICVIAALVFFVPHSGTEKAANTLNNAKVSSTANAKSTPYIMKNLPSSLSDESIQDTMHSCLESSLDTALDSLKANTIKPKLDNTFKNMLTTRTMMNLTRCVVTTTKVYPKQNETRLNVTYSGESEVTVHLDMTILNKAYSTSVTKKI